MSETQMTIPLDQLLQIQLALTKAEKTATKMVTDIEAKHLVDEDFLPREVAAVWEMYVDDVSDFSDALLYIKNVLQ